MPRALLLALGVTGALTVGLVIHTVKQAARLADATAKVADATIQLAQLADALAQSRRDLESERKASAKRVAKAKARQKALARTQRLAAAVPVVGIVAIGVIEEHDYREWRVDHADLTELEARKAYALEVVQLTTEVLDEELKVVREKFPETRNVILKLLADWQKRFLEQAPPS